MEHEECQELLGAYALDAVDAQEADGIERHLVDCPRCRAEMASFRETASVLGNTTSNVPTAVWDRIAGQIAAPPGDSWPRIAERLRVRPRPARNRRLAVTGAGLLVGVAAAAVSFLIVRVNDLDNRVHAYQKQIQAAGMSTVLSSVLRGPHRTISMTQHGSFSATIVVAPDEQAYWVKSNLPHLASNRTYQLWTLVNDRPVSLGLLGPNANDVGAFRVQPNTHIVLLTAEPEGGTVMPTTPVLLQARI